MGELVNHLEHPISPSVISSILDEVVGPNVVAVLRPQAEARAIRQPQTAAFGLLFRDLQPLTSPDPLDPLVIDEPAGIPQQSCNLAIAVTAILASQLDDVGGQPLPRPRGLKDMEGTQSIPGGERCPLLAGSRVTPPVAYEAILCEDGFTDWAGSH